MDIKYKTRGVCSRQMNIKVEDGLIENIEIIGGCNGNLNGICALVKGRPAKEVVELLKGIRCGERSTSCPDQLALALSQALAEETAEAR